MATAEGSFPVAVVLSLPPSRFRVLLLKIE